MDKEILSEKSEEDEIRLQIAKAQKKDITLFTFFNNFYSNFPGQFYRSFLESVPFNGGNLLNATLTEILNENDLNSRKLRSITYSEFFKEIDEVLTDLNVDLEFLSEQYQEKEKNWNRINDIFIPVYTKLRLKGFNHQDLTG